MIRGLVARLVLSWLGIVVMANAAVSGFSGSAFGIQVVDDQTGRGVPLVELKTVHKVIYWTDSGGWVAFDEPGLLGEEVFFHVSSPGYTYPKDGFGYEGIRLKTRRGGRAVVKVHRTQIAERLYRVTGAGIYRDTILLGRRAPLREPLLNAQVLGQDTVIVAPYRGKLYWFWGDTDRAGYPLGNFAASGAVSEFSSSGGLDPSVGVDLRYFRNSEGFARSMCPGLGKGLHWIEGVMTVRDERGEERLVARVSSQEGLKPAYAWHLMVFDDHDGVFRKQVTWDLQDGHDSSHPFRGWVGGREYLFLYPNLRVPADLQSLSNLAAYEVYTCLTDETSAGAGIDRDASGRPRYTWRAGAKRLNPGRWGDLVRAGRLSPEDRAQRLVDVETGRPVPDGRGSVSWNAFRQRWIQLVSGAPGEIWFAEADTPVGPWVYARRVVTHGEYNFYNPTQHPFFDQEGGRRVYFEGTYTAAFSGAKTMTPRYDYNQVMYRLDLADARLDLPVPIYRVGSETEGGRFVTRPILEEERLWNQARDVAFFALPLSAQSKGSVTVYDDGAGGLSLVVPPGGARAVFKAMPPGSVESGASVGTLTLFQRRSPEGRTSNWVSDQGGPDDQPICRVWARPAGVMVWDATIQEKPQSR